MNRKLTITWGILLAFLLFLILLSNFTLAYYNGINVYDFGIYQQSIYEMAAGNSWNPFLTVRGVHTFNDHVDPIIFLGALWVKCTSYTPYSLLMFEWSWLIVSLIWIYKKADREFFLYFVSMLLVCRGVIMGFDYPIHPTTWTIFPLLIFSYGLVKEKFKLIFFSVLSLVLFKEIYPFMLVGLGGFYLLTKDWKKSLYLFITAIIFIVLYFVIRPKVIGPGNDYGGGLLKNLLSNPLGYLWECLKETGLQPKVFLPLIGLIIYTWMYQTKKSIIMALFYIAPLIAVHILGKRIELHHMVPMCTPFLGIWIFSFKKPIEKKQKIFLGLIFAAMIFTVSSRYTKMINTGIRHKSQHAVMTKAKSESMDYLESTFTIIDPKLPMLATGGIVPKVMKPGMQIYQFTKFPSTPLVYSYLLLEKQANGDISPLRLEVLNSIISDCGKVAKTVIFEDDWFLLWQGSFTESCLHMNEW